MNSIEGDNAVERKAKGADQLSELRGESKRLRQPEPITAWDNPVECKIREGNCSAHVVTLSAAKGLVLATTRCFAPLSMTACDSPLLDPSWRTAYKLLQDHGFAPDWIELDKEIRIESSFSTSRYPLPTCSVAGSRLGKDSRG